MLDSPPAPRVASKGMEPAASTTAVPVRFETDPARYVHWRLEIDPPLGRLELALACDEILLVDDASSAVSLPEVPLLGVLPGTGGLTRVVDKRKVRRDLADVFASLGEGVKGKRAVQWRLVDETAPLSKFAARTAERAGALAEAAPARSGPGVELKPLEGKYTA